MVQIKIHQFKILHCAAPQKWKSQLLSNIRVIDDRVRRLLENSLFRDYSCHFESTGVPKTLVKKISLNIDLESFGRKEGSVLQLLVHI